MKISTRGEGFAKGSTPSRKPCTSPQGILSALHVPSTSSARQFVPDSLATASFRDFCGNEIRKLSYELPNRFSKGQQEVGSLLSPFSFNENHKCLIVSGNILTFSNTVSHPNHYALILIYLSNLSIILHDFNTIILCLYKYSLDYIIVFKCSLFFTVFTEGCLTSFSNSKK